jgi:hypothetical protein
MISQGLQAQNDRAQDKNDEKRIGGYSGEKSWSHLVNDDK